MSRHSLISIHFLFVALAATSCADESTPVAADAGTDVSMVADFAGMDVSAGDAGFDVGQDASVDVGLDVGFDEGLPDMSVPTGFGVITGQCGEIDMSELLSSQPFLFVNAIDFQMDPYDDTDLPRLTAGGQEIIADGNAGGSSIMSEVLSYEVLERCDMASLLKTETEIVYQTQGKITDLLVQLDGLKVGVSVTRAVSFPRDSPYSEATALNLLDKKLADILLSSANVAPEDAWQKQILHVLVDRPEHVPVLEGVLQNIDATVRADTIVVLTVTEGSDDFVY